jgi:hypothetical protein
MTQTFEKSLNQHMIRQNVEALNLWIEGFLRHCRVRDLSHSRLNITARSLLPLRHFAARDVIQVPEITADLLRSYFLELETTGHKPGGRHAKI